MLRMSEIVAAIDENEFNVKMAGVEAAYANDSQRQELLVATVEMLKQGEAEGRFEPMTDSQMLSVAAQLVEEHMSKVAGETGEAEGSEELTEEEADELYNLGVAGGEALALGGLTAEDLDKIASDEEAYQLGLRASEIIAALNSEE